MCLLLAVAGVELEVDRKRVTMTRCPRGRSARSAFRGLRSIDQRTRALTEQCSILRSRSSVDGRLDARTCGSPDGADEFQRQGHPCRPPQLFIMVRTCPVYFVSS